MTRSSGSRCKSALGCGFYRMACSTSSIQSGRFNTSRGFGPSAAPTIPSRSVDRKSTRLNSSHLGISYAVFCLKKKITEVIRRVDAVDDGAVVQANDNDQQIS